MIDCKGNEDVNPNQLFNDLENDPESGIRAIVKYLRVDDFRILPIGVSTESKRRQRQIEILENSPESIQDFDLPLSPL